MKSKRKDVFDPKKVKISKESNPKETKFGSKEIKPKKARKAKGGFFGKKWYPHKPDRLKS